jgi:rRNA maturation endonuclease Nob1
LSESEAKKKEKTVKLEKIAEETGEVIGKGIRKTWKVAKSFGKGLVDTVEKKEQRRDAVSLTCPHCGASIPPDSNFCASCGKKL